MRFFLPILLLLSGCGYQFQGSGSALPVGINKIWISPIQNETKYASLDTSLENALRLRFNRYGAVSVSKSRQNSHASLNTKVIDVSERTIGVTSDTDIAVDSEIIMLISAELVSKSGEILWRNPNLVTSAETAGVSDIVVTSSSDFAQGSLSSSDLSQLGDREVSRSQEEEALRELVNETARRIYLSAITPSF